MFTGFILGWLVPIVLFGDGHSKISVVGLKGMHYLRCFFAEGHRICIYYY